MNTVQERIEDGTYPAGSTLPSEATLMKEFSVSRPTAVRALELLRQQGWIDAHQGRGRTVLGSPVLRSRPAPPHARDVLGACESQTATVTVDFAGPVLAPPRVANALELPAGTPVIARRRLVTHEEIGPVELSTVYLPVELASGTGAADSTPLPDGLLGHLTRLTGVEFDHATERISARTPTAEETRLLNVGKRDCLLTILLTVFDRTGRPQVAADLALPAARRELEDSFAVG